LDETAECGCKNPAPSQGPLKWQTQFHLSPKRPSAGLRPGKTVHVQQ
jgi:hypothetical protein